MNGVLGVSDAFGISSPLGVGGTTFTCALRGAVPNSGRRSNVSFNLPDAAPTTLAIYDVAGRKVSRQSVGELGAGRHTVPLASSTLAPGIYRVQLTRGERRLTTRAVILR